MHTIPLISSELDLPRRLEAVTAECRSEPPGILALSNSREAVDYLGTEMPELVFIQFPDPDLDSYGLLETIRADPWLLHGGIIGLCDDDDAVDRLENTQGANLVAALSPDSLDRQLPRVLDIIDSNRRILFQREIGASLFREISGHFRLNNDPLEARCFTNLVCNFLFNANRIDSEVKDSLNLAMYEMLVNAIEHGNCGITYAEKSEWLREHSSMEGLIEQRCRDPEVAGRQVVFEYTIAPDASRFLIADEGSGFDWRGLEGTATTSRLLEMHGRGILLTRAVTRNLSYNEKGNEVRFELAHQSDQASTTPVLLEGIDPRILAPNEFVFREGDPGNALYYIVKGRYDVLVGKQTIATLSPEDIFLGEMSFLLNNRRSASVRAATEGKLIEVSKRGFVDAIRRHPHYSLMLSRLLAQRIERSNKLRGTPEDRA